LAGVPTFFKCSHLFEPTVSNRSPSRHRDTGTEDDDETLVNASEEDEFEILSVTASRPMILAESYFCFDSGSDFAFVAFQEVTWTDARMGASIDNLSEHH
jgi:hypothetical protein